MPTIPAKILLCFSDFFWGRGYLISPRSKVKYLYVEPCFEVSSIFSTPSVYTNCRLSDQIEFVVVDIENKIILRYCLSVE